jgi:hypothetical protein
MIKQTLTFEVLSGGASVSTDTAATDGSGAGQFGDGSLGDGTYDNSAVPVKVR